MNVVTTLSEALECRNCSETVQTCPECGGYFEDPVKRIICVDNDHYHMSCYEDKVRRESEKREKYDTLEEKVMDGLPYE